MIELLEKFCSSGSQGAVMAALIPGINIVKVLLIGLGILKDEAAVKSMSRDGDYRFIILLNMCMELFLLDLLKQIGMRRTFVLIRKIH